MNKTTIVITSALVVVFLLTFSLASAQQKPLNLKVGIYENFPLIFTNESGEADGLYGNVLSYIAEQEGWNLEYVPGSFSEGLTRLENNEIDIMTGIAASAKRRELYDFSDESMFLNWGSLYVASDSQFASTFDLEGKKVAALDGDIYYIGESGIINLLDDFEIKVEYVEVDTYPRVLELVERGDTTAGVVSRTFGNLEGGNYAVKPTGHIFNPIEIMFAFPKDRELNTSLQERLDFHVLSLKEDPSSIYHQSLERYFAGAPVAQDFSSRIMWMLGAAVVLALLIGFVFNRRNTRNKI